MVPPTRSTSLLLILSLLTPLFLAVTARAQSPVARVTVTHAEAVAQADGAVQVSVFVSAVDDQGQPVQGLRAEDFTLQENGVPIAKNLVSAAPATRPLTVTLLINTAAGMAASAPNGVRAIDLVKDATVALVDSLAAGDAVAVYEYNRQVLPRQELTYDHNLAVDQGIRALDVREAKEACLYDALTQAVGVSAKMAGGRRVVVAIAGNSTAATAKNCSGATRNDVAVAATSGDRIPVFLVGFGRGLDEEDWSLLAQLSGGQSLVAPNASALSDLTRKVSDALRGQYELTYLTQAAPGLAKVMVTEASSGLSDTRPVLIPKAIEPTPTPLPQFAIALAPEPPDNNGKMRIAVKVPADVVLQKTELYVDGKKEQEITSPPFDVFDIDMAQLSSGKHTFKVMASAQNGVTAEAEAGISLTKPPTPLPSTPASTTAPAAPRVTLQTGLALLLVVVGIALLLVVTAVGYFVLRQLNKTPTPAAVVLAPVTPIVTVDDGPAEDLDRTKDVEETPEVNAQLVVVEGDQFLGPEPPSSFDLAKAETKIGRNGSRKYNINDIDIKDTAVSRSHAAILYRQGKFYVRDMESKGGTMLNDAKIKSREDVPLQNGDAIDIGHRVKFRFEILGSISDDTVIGLDQDELATRDEEDKDKTLHTFKTGS